MPGFQFLARCNISDIFVLEFPDQSYFQRDGEFSTFSGIREQRECDAPWSKYEWILTSKGCHKQPCFSILMLVSLSILLAGLGTGFDIWPDGRIGHPFSGLLVSFVIICMMKHDVLHSFFYIRNWLYETAGSEGKRIRNFRAGFQRTYETLPIESNKYVNFLYIWYDNHQIWPKIKKLLRNFETSNGLIFKKLWWLKIEAVPYSYSVS